MYIYTYIYTYIYKCTFVSRERERESERERKRERERERESEIKREREIVALWITPISRHHFMSLFYIIIIFHFMILFSIHFIIFHFVSYRQIAWFQIKSRKGFEINPENVYRVRYAIWTFRKRTKSDVLRFFCNVTWPHIYVYVYIYIYIYIHMHIDIYI